MTTTINASNSGSGGLVQTADASGILALQTAGTTAVTIDTSQNATFAGYANLPNTFGFKNRIINGAMVIDQRNAGASVTVSNAAGIYSVDRFAGLCQQATGAFTMQQSSTVPTGFVNSLLFTVTNTTAPSSANRVSFRQPVEGYNISDFGWGSASAATVTLSFWVRSSLTGTYGVGFINSAENRSYVGLYTVNSANTWEYKTITVPGDTSGTWLTTNGNGIRLTFDLGSGSAFNASSASTWVAQEACRTSACVNWQQNSGATFYITGVQLEKGSTATSFDVRSYTTEQTLCYRYCIAYGGDNNVEDLQGLGNCNGGTTSTFITPLPVRMRATPTVTSSSVSYFTVLDNLYTNYSVTALAGDRWSSQIATLAATTGSSARVGPVRLVANNTAALIVYSAEL